MVWNMLLQYSFDYKKLKKNDWRLTRIRVPSPFLLTGDTGGGVATREPGGGVTQGETLRLRIWGRCKPGDPSGEMLHTIGKP